MFALGGMQDVLSGKARAVLEVRTVCHPNHQEHARNRMGAKWSVPLCLSPLGNLGSHGLTREPLEGNFLFMCSSRALNCISSLGLRFPELTIHGLTHVPIWHES